MKSSTPNSPRGNSLRSGSPAHIGAILGIAVGVVLTVYALEQLFTSGEDPEALKWALLIAGAANIAACWLALRRDRVGWSFALSLNGALAIACFLGSPKVRDILEVDLAIGMIPSAIFATITVLLVTGGRAFERTGDS